MTYAPSMFGGSHHVMRRPLAGCRRMRHRRRRTGRGIRNILGKLWEGTKYIGKHALPAGLAAAGTILAKKALGGRRRRVRRLGLGRRRHRGKGFFSCCHF